MSEEFLPTGTSYEEQSGNAGDGLARFYWMNGEPRDKTPGRFWMDQERASNAGLIALPQPWKAITHTFKRGDTADLFMSPALRIAPIVWKQQNFIKDASGNVESWIEEKKFGKLAQGEGIAFELLCLVQGIDIPLVLSMKSTKASMAWAANILPDYKKLRDAVKKSRNGATVPPWWFWLNIRSAIKADKTPAYETINGSVITPPTWVAPADVSSRDAWKELYVGNELASIGEAIYLDTGKAWATRKISDGYQRQDVEPTNDRNVPQVYQEDEAGIPF